MADKKFEDMKPVERNRAILDGVLIKRGNKSEKMLVEFAKKVRSIGVRHGIKNESQLLKHIEEKFGEPAPPTPPPPHEPEPEPERAPDPDDAEPAIHWTAGAISVAAEAGLDKVEVEEFLGADRITKADVEEYVQLMAEGGE